MKGRRELEEGIQEEKPEAHIGKKVGRLWLRSEITQRGNIPSA
jgi:hypothetical protein